MAKTYWFYRGIIALVGFVIGVALVRFLTPTAISLEWETASEVGTLGFYVYRAESPDGPFTLVNTEPVPVQGDALTGSRYTYLDKTTRWGHRYYYQLESLEQDGGRQRYPDLVEAQAGLAWPWLMLGGVATALVAVLLIPAQSPSKETA